MFVLGADDPEMVAIERLLRGHGHIVAYAATEEGRCHPGNAYKAEGVIFDGQTLVPVEKLEGYEVVLVEAGFTSPFSGSTVVIDHHRPGDPGYDLGPDQYWTASSLGQLVDLLTRRGVKIEITQDMRVLAAMDHCRQAAIRGECPGVTAEEVIDRRVAEIARGTGTPESKVKTLIRGWQHAILAAPLEAFGPGQVVDITGADLGAGYNAGLLALQTALDIQGRAGLLRHRDVEDGPYKITISGHVSPEMVNHFTDVYAPWRRLVCVYDVPARGYAGGYFS